MRTRWVDALSRHKPLICVYSGNPRYGNAPTPIDSIVAIRAAIEALGDMSVHVVLITGYQGVPWVFGKSAQPRYKAITTNRAICRREWHRLKTLRLMLFVAPRLRAP
jgi:hypothetical protein